mmetsp:Transcript_48291/g.127515  ORF Transcript_48291/g.127515 Transcript_48291/m.127515 type:complete len:507 (-) Transcript_48291:54-1574(-)
MGAFQSSFLQIVSSATWNEYGRGEKIRQIFGAYEAQDCWAVVRRFRQMDDGNGWIDYEELQKLIGAEEFSLLFLWDLYSQQNELVNALELLTTVSIFSNARLEEKGAFLVSLFDNSKSGSCTGEEICKMCVTVATVMQRCTSVLVKAKELIPPIRKALPSLVPAYAAEVESVGENVAFKVKRVFSPLELPRLLDVVRDAYLGSPLGGTKPRGAAVPPPPAWGITAGAAAPKAAADPAKAALVAAAAKAEGARKPKPEEAELPHLAWMSMLDEPGAKAAEVEKVHRWMVMHGGDFRSIAKDLPSFRRSFVKCVCHSLAVPSTSVEVISVSPGSVVVEFVLQARNAESLAALLREQCANSHSKLRTSQMGAHMQLGGDLFSGAPKLAKQRLEPVTQVDQEVQVNGLDICMPKAPPSRAKVQIARAKQGVETGAQGEVPAAEDDPLAAQLREALKQVEKERKRLQLAEAGCLKALADVREKDDIIAALKAQYSHHHQNDEWSSLFGMAD